MVTVKDNELRTA